MITYIKKSCCFALQPTMDYNEDHDGTSNKISTNGKKKSSHVKANETTNLAPLPHQTYSKEARVLIPETDSVSKL